MYIIVLLLIGTSLLLLDTKVSVVDVVSLPCYLPCFATPLGYCNTTATIVPSPF